MWPSKVNIKGKTCTQNDINSPRSLLAWPSSEGIGVDTVENIATAGGGVKSKLRGDPQSSFAVILKGPSICKPRQAGGSLSIPKVQSQGLKCMKPLC